MSSAKNQVKNAVQIPVKNIQIHKAKGVETYQPSDQIYVRKVKGFFQQLRRRMNMVYFTFLLYYLGCNTTVIKRFYLILIRSALPSGD